MSSRAESMHNSPAKPISSRRAALFAASGFQGQNNSAAKSSFSQKGNPA